MTDSRCVPAAAVRRATFQDSPQASASPVYPGAALAGRDLVRALLLVALAAGGPILFSGCAAVGSATPAPTVPAAIAAAAGLTVRATHSAAGVQIYVCDADAGGARWSFVRPEAWLLDARGDAVGLHGAGPFWHLRDGSRVVGRVLASSPSPRGDAIPWLLLAVRSEGGTGVLEGVEQIQRIDTVGGLAPSAEVCTAERRGAQLRVPYTARYHYFASR